MTSPYLYDVWMEKQSIPVHRGYYVEDLRSAQLGWWGARGRDAAFIQLQGQQGICEARVEAVPASGTLRAEKLGVDELVYVLAGRGACTVWGGERERFQTFEWSARSLFLIPSNTWTEFSNMSGDHPARLLRYNYLPLAITATGDVDGLFNSTMTNAQINVEDLYSDAQAVHQKPSEDLYSGFLDKSEVIWTGNFFPDMQIWDKFSPEEHRGIGASTVVIKPPNSEMSCHMSVFPARTYKKAHRHDPGRVIVIPDGRGYSIMWPEHEEPVVVPWAEGSMFVPPNHWFHQHFNLGDGPGRYLALHPPVQFAGRAETLEDVAGDQIEYANEAPWIRARFESELEALGLTSMMPSDVFEPVA